MTKIEVNLKKEIPINTVAVRLSYFRLTLLPYSVSPGHQANNSGSGEIGSQPRSQGFG